MHIKGMDCKESPRAAAAAAPPAEEEAPAPPLAPFPLLPAAIHITSMLAAAYPHFDIDVNHDKVIFATGPKQFEDSLRYSSLGCCLLLLGYYCCQFVSALAPIRKEYLGTLGLMQMLYVALLAARLFLFPAAARADLAGSVVCLLIAAIIVPLVQYDAATTIELDTVVPQKRMSEERAARLAANKARLTAMAPTAAWLVPTATHAVWLLYALLFNLPYILPYVPTGRAVLDALAFSTVPYQSAAALLVDGLALTRLALFVASARRRSTAADGGVPKAKSE